MDFGSCSNKNLDCIFTSPFLPRVALPRTRSLDERSLANHRVQQRAALLAPNIVSVLLAEDQYVVLDLGDAQLVALDPKDLKAESVARRQFEQWQSGACLSRQ